MTPFAFEGQGGEAFKTLEPISHHRQTLLNTDVKNKGPIVIREARDMLGGNGIIDEYPVIRHKGHGGRASFGGGAGDYGAFGDSVIVKQP